MEVRADEDGSGGAIIKYYYGGALSALGPLSWKERRRLHEDTKTAIVEGEKGGRRRQPRKYRLATKDHDITTRRREREEEEEGREGLYVYNGKYRLSFCWREAGCGLSLCCWRCRERKRLEHPAADYSYTQTTKECVLLFLFSLLPLHANNRNEEESSLFLSFRWRKVIPPKR